LLRRQCCRRLDYLVAGIRSLTRTRAGHTERWTSVTLPFTRRKRTTSGESDNSLITPKIAWLAGWPHQLPVIGSPATSSATFGIGPRADSRSTPCSARSAVTSTIRTQIARPAPCPLPLAEQERPWGTSSSEPQLTIRLGDEVVPAACPSFPPIPDRCGAPHPPLRGSPALARLRTMRLIAERVATALS